MKLYSESNQYKLYDGNMLDMLEVIEKESIDSIVTDPPYGLTSITKGFGKESSAPAQYGKDGAFSRLSKGFMGKEWDGSGIEYNVETWQKCYEVLKPGGYLLAFGGTRTYHRIACAIEDAGFEIRDCIMWLYGCYSADTQVLTNKGWKYFYELGKTEKILQWDKDTNKLSWIKPLNYFEYDIDDEMVLLENRHTSQLLSKNHKVIAKIQRNKRKQVNGVRKIISKKGNYEIIEAQNLDKHWNISLPIASNLDGEIDCKYPYMLGWWLTDAYKHKDGKACMFMQSKHKTLQKLKAELDRLKELGECNYSEYIKDDGNINHKPEHIFYVTGKLADYLLTNYNDREMTWDLLNFNLTSKKELLQGLMDGDGSVRKGSYSKTFWTKKQIRKDIMSALLTTMNYRNYIVEDGVAFNVEHNSTEISYKHRKPMQKYKGKIYCLETETGAFVVRRNGKPFISGNSGFPKSMDISKQIDKRNKNTKEEYIKFGNYLKEKREQNNLSKLELGRKLFTYESNREDVPIQSYEIGKELPTKKDYEKLKIILNLNNSFDWLIEREEAKREVIGKGKAGLTKGNMLTFSGKDEFDITKPATELAKQWEGWGTCLKPAYEPIIVARKPFKGSLVDNIIENGVGGINIDECRIGNEHFSQEYNETPSKGIYGNKKLLPKEYDGRFPSNVILTYNEEDKEEVCGGMPYSKSKQLTGNENYTYTNSIYNEFKPLNSIGGFNDEGSASRYFKNCQYTRKDEDICRYFYSGKASKKDRDSGLDMFEEYQTTDGCIRSNIETARKFGANSALRKNTHPTVKPTTLMQYLVRLVSPKGATILDPFMGSGSTGKAVIYENKERQAKYKFIGIELTEQYLPIAEARIKDAEMDTFEYNEENNNQKNIKLIKNKLF